jgi:hypothetical protein
MMVDLMVVLKAETTAVVTVEMTDEKMVES